MSKSDQTQNAPKRWSARRKAEVVMRIFRGEPLDDLSRELGVEIYRLEKWRDQATEGMTEMLKDRVDDPLANELSRAKKQIGELTMEVELLRETSRRKHPLAHGRLRK